MSDRLRVAETLACKAVDMEITPPPTEQERAAIEATLAAEAPVERESGWNLLPRREDDLEDA